MKKVTFSWCFGLFIIGVVLSLVGCSSVKSLFSGDQSTDYNELTYGKDYQTPTAKGTWSNDDVQSGARNVASAKSSYYDEKDQASAGTGKLDPTDDRVRQDIETGRGLAVANYNKGDRATRGDFLDSAPNDGSLWSNSNDANYFFTKGKIHSMGDIISVKVEDPMIKQMAEEIKKTLTPAEQEVEMALYTKNNAGAKDDKDLTAYRNVASEDLSSSEAEAVKAKMEKSVRWSQVDLASTIGVAPNEEIHAEVIDRYPNGNYKIRAIKRILYRGSSRMVSMVGVAPAADFDDKDVIASGKLYEYKLKVAR